MFYLPFWPGSSGARLSIEAVVFGAALFDAEVGCSWVKFEAQATHEAFGDWFHDISRQKYPEGNKHNWRTGLLRIHDMFTLRRRHQSTTRWHFLTLAVGIEKERENCPRNGRRLRLWVASRCRHCIWVCNGGKKTWWEHNVTVSACKAISVRWHQIVYCHYCKCFNLRYSCRSELS